MVDAVVVPAGLELADTASRLGGGDGPATAGLLARVRANAHYLLGDEEGGDAGCDALVEAAVASGDASQQAHAHYMRSVGSSAQGDDEGAAASADSAFAAARRSGAATDLAGAWAAQGFAERSDRAALDAFAEADRLASAAGNRWMSAFARTEASILRVVGGDGVTTGCRGLADTVDVWYRAGEWAQQWLTLSRCVLALDRIGRPEVAAEVIGAVDANATLDAAPIKPTVRALVLATSESVGSQLGEDQASERLADGARLPLSALIHRTRSALLDLPESP